MNGAYRSPLSDDRDDGRPLINGIGLNQWVMSYEGHVDFGIIADRQILPETVRLMDGIRASLAELPPAGVHKPNTA
jgi:hypothetical protein